MTFLNSAVYAIAYKTVLNLNRYNIICHAPYHPVCAKSRRIHPSMEGNVRPDAGGVRPTYKMKGKIQMQIYNKAPGDDNRRPQGPSLLTLYNALDWIDFLLIFVIIAYVAISPIAFDFYDWAYLDVEYMWYTIINSLTVVDLMLCIASLIVTIAAIVTAILIYKKGLNKNPFRLVGRFIVWGVWVPIDVYLIVMALRGLAG